MPQPAVRYAGFWPRLGAMLLDIAFLLPMGWLVNQGTAHSRLFFLAWQGLGLLIFLFFDVYMVGRFGGSPGKLIAGLRIVRLDGSPIGYDRAFLRQAPDIALSIAIGAGLMVTALALGEQGYLAARQNRNYYQVLKGLGPGWLHWADIAEQVWFWSELLVLLTNEKRRALHDFLAGTVVIHYRPLVGRTPVLQSAADSQAPD